MNHDKKCPDELPKGLRKFEPEDTEILLEILNETAETGANSPFTRPMTLDEITMMLNYWSNDNQPVYVLERKNRVLGWVSVTAFSWGTQACRQTGEISVYVKKEYHSKGLGYRLCQASIILGRRYGFENLVAWIMERNAASKMLTEAFGGTLWARLPNIARFGDRRSDVFLYGMSLLPQSE